MQIHGYYQHLNVTMMSNSDSLEIHSFIATFGKDNESLIYYIIDYITKTLIYTMHMHYILHIAIF